MLQEKLKEDAPPCKIGGQTDGYGCMDRQMDSEINRRIDEQIDGQIDRDKMRMDRCVDEQEGMYLDSEWIDRWSVWYPGKWAGKLVGGWVGGYVGRQVDNRLVGGKEAVKEALESFKEDGPHP